MALRDCVCVFAEAIQPFMDTLVTSRVLILEEDYTELQ